MIKIIEISKDTVTDICAKYCIEERQEVYFMAYENDMVNRVSVLWSDLTFLRRNFGVKRFDVNSNITKKSLNDGRKHNIENLKTAIKQKANVYDVEQYWNGSDFGMESNPKYGKLNPDGSMDLRKHIPRTPRPATPEMIERYQADINKGLYVICKYV